MTPPLKNPGYAPDLFSLQVCFVFPGELNPLSSHNLRADMQANKTKFERNSSLGVLSHDLYWKNKTYKLKRSIDP